MILPVVLIIVLIIAPIVGFMIVYQGFNLQGIPCIDSLDNIVNKLNRIDIDIPIEEQNCL